MALMLPLPQKYVIKHPFLTPEHYSLLPNVYQPINSLLLPLSDPPVIVSNYYHEIIAQVFPNQSYLTLYLSDNYHMVISESLQSFADLNNYVATQLFRIDALKYNHDKKHLSIKGDALLFGTHSVIEESYVSGNYSIPYELVEQSYNLYETANKTKQIKML